MAFESEGIEKTLLLSGELGDSDLWLRGNTGGGRVRDGNLLDRVQLLEHRGDAEVDAGAVEPALQ